MKVVFPVVFPVVPACFSTLVRVAQDEGLGVVQRLHGDDWGFSTLVRVAQDEGLRFPGERTCCRRFSTLVRVAQDEGYASKTGEDDGMDVSVPSFGSLRMKGIGPQTSPEMHKRFQYPRSGRS